MKTELDSPQPGLADTSAAETCCPPQLDQGDEGAVALAPSDTIVDRLKALADPTRLRMLDLLAQRGAPLCVCEITARFPQNQPTISHHLRILREAGLAACEKRGVWAYHWATEEGRRAMTVVRALY